MPLSAATPEPVEIDQVLSTFDAPTRVAIQENLVEFGNALAGRGPALNVGARQACPRRAPVLKPVMQQPRLAARPSSPRFIRALGADRRRGRAGGRDPGAAVRQPRHHLHRARRGRPPVHPGDDLRGAADRGDGDPHAAPDPAASSPTAPALFTDLRARAASAAPDLADDRLRARGRERRCSPTRPAQQAAGADRRVAPAAQRTTAAVRAGLSRLRPGDRQLGPTMQLRHPGADGLQLRDAALPQPRRPLHRGHDLRPLAAVHRLRPARRARTARASPSSGPPTAAAPTTRTSCTPTRIRTPRRPGRPASARPATSPTRPARSVFGNVPGNQGTNTENQDSTPDQADSTTP